MRVGGDSNCDRGCFGGEGMMSPEAVAVKVVWKETVELDQSMECAQWAPPESEWGLADP